MLRYRRSGRNHRARGDVLCSGVALHVGGNHLNVVKVARLEVDEYLVSLDDLANGRIVLRAGHAAKRQLARAHGAGDGSRDGLWRGCCVLAGHETHFVDNLRGDIAHEVSLYCSCMFPICFLFASDGCSHD